VPEWGLCAGLAAEVRNKTKMIDVIRALDTGISLCCSVRQHSLEIQASDQLETSSIGSPHITVDRAGNLETLKL